MPTSDLAIAPAPMGASPSETPSLLSGILGSNGASLIAHDQSSSLNGRPKARTLDRTIALDEDGYPLGTRLVSDPSEPDGYRTIYLTVEDLYSPEEGDELVRADWNVWAWRFLSRSMKHWLETIPNSWVTSDQRVNWPSGLHNSPDIGFFLNVPAGYFGKYDATLELKGTTIQAWVIIEFVSDRNPAVAEIDTVVKVDDYAEEGNIQYIMVLLNSQRGQPLRMRLDGRVLDPLTKQYVPGPVNQRGHIPLLGTGGRFFLGLWINPENDLQYVTLFDQDGNCLNLPTDNQRDFQNRLSEETKARQQLEALLRQMGVPLPGEGPA